LLARLRLERPVRAVYDGVHVFRERTGLLVGLFAFTVAIQAVRVLAIWSAGRAVGIDLSPRIYYVMGPLFFLVLLVPFTLNGFAVREAFFVSFLGSVGVDADQAFAAGFLFFLVTVAMALPAARSCSGRGCAAAPRPMPDASVVVVTYNALPWIEQCIESVQARRSSSSTTARPTGRSRSSASCFPQARVIERENLGLASGWNAGMAVAAAATSCS
jgi:hypothetical protein